MKKHYLIMAMSATLIQGCYTAPAYQSSSQVSVGVGYPGVNIGINYSAYPDLVLIPGYPVYYDPRVSFNFFFYDGLYWVFQGDNWYASGWYNGPWNRVGYYDVPVYVLRVPVRYYRQPPPYFRGWRADAPPRWGDHWGRDWEQRRSGWDRWDRSATPPPAPLPNYQRNYSGDRYPRATEQQRAIQSENYRYRPRDPEAQKYFQPRVQQAPQRQQDLQRSQDQQRQQDLQHRQEQQRSQDQQRQQDLQHRQERQERQRPQDQQRQQQPKQPQDLQRQRSQPEPQGMTKGRNAPPQDQGQKDKGARQEYEWKKKADEER